MMQESMKIKGSVVLMKKNLFELNDITASFHDRLDEILGHKVSLQLISAVNNIHTHGMSFTNITINLSTHAYIYFCTTPSLAILICRSF